MRHNNPPKSFVEIEIIGREPEAPKLLDVLNFLYDWNLLYEIGRLATDSSYSDFSFTNSVYFRNGRPLRSEDRLTLELLSHNSPTRLTTRIANTAAVIGAIWVLAQTAEKMILLPEQQQKLREEVRHLRLTNDKLESEAQTPPAPTSPQAEDIDYIRTNIETRNAGPYLLSVSERLLASPVRLEDMEIRVVEEP